MRLKELILILLTLSGFILSTSIYSQKIQEEERLNSNINLLISNLEEKNATIFDINKQYTDLTDSYNSLLSSYTSLTTEKKELQSQLTYEKNKYTQLTSQFDQLKTQNNELLEENKISNATIIYLQEKAAFQLGNSLDSFYDLVRNDYGLNGDRYGNNYIMRDQFAASLASHDLGKNTWPNIETSFFIATNQHSYELSKNKLDYFIQLCEINETDTPSLKIDKILDKVNQFIVYQSDVVDVYRSPVEVLDLKSGDCDDYSILVAALFERVGIDSAVGTFENDNHDLHAMVLIRLDDVDFEYWFWDNLTDYGLQSGRWIHIEPQRTIEEQGNHDMDQWTLISTCEIS
jgi:hypothetical protein